MGEVWPACIVFLVAACGRVGFDPVVDASHDVAPTAPWTLVQVVGQTSSPVVLSPTTPGSLIAVEIQRTSSGAITAVTDDASGGGNPYVSAGADATDAPGNNALELWFAAGARGGATHVTIGGSGILAAVVWEVSGIAANALDTVSIVGNGPSTISPLGPPITTLAPGDMVISSAVTSSGIRVMGIHPGNAFTNDSMVLVNGWAHLTDPAAPPGSYQAQWDNNAAGTYCANAAAFFVGP